MIQETSIQAYKDLLPELGERQILILKAIRDLTNKQGDATDQEIKVYLGSLDPNFVRPRRNELVNDFKLVGYSQKRECRVTGKTALAWKVLDKQLDRIINSQNKKEIEDY